MQRFRALTADLIRRDLTRSGHAPTDADLTFLIGGLFATLETWLATNCREAQQALLQRLRRQIALFQ